MIAASCFLLRTPLKLDTSSFTLVLSLPTTFPLASVISTSKLFKCLANIPCSISCEPTDIAPVFPAISLFITIESPTIKPSALVTSSASIRSI